MTSHNLISRKLARFADNRRYHGVRRALFQFADALTSKLTGLSCFHVLRLEVERMNRSLVVPSELTCRFLTSDEIAEFAADPENKIDADFAERIAAGHLCYAALAGDALAAYSWYVTQEIDAMQHWGLEVKLPPATALAYSAFTRPEFRGQRLQGSVAVQALHDLGAIGVRQIIALVQVRNQASLRGALRTGSEDLGLLVTWSKKRRLMHVPRKARALGLEFYDCVAITRRTQSAINRRDGRTVSNALIGAPESRKVLSV